MATILPLSAELPESPKSQEELLRWSQDFSRAFQSIYTTIARRLENDHMEAASSLRPAVQGVRRLFFPTDLDQIDAEVNGVWRSLAGASSFISHLNSPIVNASILNFNLGSTLNVTSTTYVNIDTNFKITLTTSANKVVLGFLSGGIVHANGTVLTGHMHIAVDADLTGGSANGILQPVRQTSGDAYHAGVAFTGWTTLTAASHVFQPVVRTTAGTFSIVGNTHPADTLTLAIIELMHGNT